MTYYNILYTTINKRLILYSQKYIHLVFNYICTKIHIKIMTIHIYKLLHKCLLFLSQFFNNVVIKHLLLQNHVQNDIHSTNVK